MENLEFIVALLSSLSALLAIAIKLWRILSELAEEKKYGELFGIIASAMIEAEEISALSGDEKKSRVIEAVEDAASALGIRTLDTERISDLIEEIVRITKKVNSK